MMRRDEQLTKLAGIAELALDSKLARLRSAAAAKAATAAQIANLASKAAPIDGADAISCALTQLSYEKWADARRLTLNLTLANQTVTWLEATDDARRAFGKKMALAGLAKRG